MKYGKDFEKNPSKQQIPYGFEYWKPEWKFIDGQVVKEVKEEEKTEVFQCNKCDFISKTEHGIKIHIGTRHRDEF